MAGEETHFSHVTWINENLFTVYWMNRPQTRTVLALCQTKGLKPCEELFQYQVSNINL